MTRVSDDMLMAYADDELDPKERERIEKLLASDPEARERLAMFTETTRLARQSFDQVLTEPVPERLIQQIRGTEERKVEVREKQTFAERLRETMASFLQPSYAFAAVAVLAVGAVLGLTVAPSLVSRDAQVPLLADDTRDPELHLALESAPSGDLVELVDGDAGGERQIIPLVTFRDRTGRYCREFEEVAQLDGQSTATFGVACRTDDGVWQNEILLTNDLANPGGNVAANGDAYEMAAGETDLSIDAIVDALRDGPPLTPEEEAAAISSGWTAAN